MIPTIGHSEKGKTTEHKKTIGCQKFKGERLIGEAQGSFRAVKLFCMIIVDT